jgi:hypothetical protein
LSRPGHVTEESREIYAPVTIEIHFHNYLTTARISAVEISARPDSSPPERRIPFRVNRRQIAANRALLRFLSRPIEKLQGLADVSVLSLRFTRRRCFDERMSIPSIPSFSLLSSSVQRNVRKIAEYYRPRARSPLIAERREIWYNGEYEYGTILLLIARTFSPYRSGFTGISSTLEPLCFRRFCYIVEYRP